MKKSSNYGIVFFVLLIALFFRFFIFSAYKIPTNSMEPTFLPGDFILSSRISYGFRLPWAETVWLESSPQKNDLVVFKFKGKPGTPYIKRVVATAGETLTDASGKPVVVPPAELFVASDNHDLSDDTKEGFVAIADVAGQAKFIWYSSSKESGIRWSRIFSVPK